MKVLMFGWEFPPHISGGLGTACYGLTKGLAHHRDVNVLFVVPKAYGDEDQTTATLIGADQTEIKMTSKNYEGFLKEINYIEVHSNLIPYTSPEEYHNIVSAKDYKGQELIHTEYQGKFEFTGKYGEGLFQEIANYAVVADTIGRQYDFDIIHAHDWLTFPAGIAAKHASGKKLVVHVHATDFDRSGGSVNPGVYDIERSGMEAADKIIAVSNLTRNTIIEKYGISPDKVVTIHNAVDPFIHKRDFIHQKGFDDKIVTFLGRVTLQKGPEYFIEAANKVLHSMENVRFVMAGSGDMLQKMIHRVASLGISDKFHFTGFLSGDDVYKMFYLSDLYVMPSVSEPFGISPLEAIQSNVPVIISHQSGVSEVLKYAFKVDFWDIDGMADAIYGILNYEGIKKLFNQFGKSEVEHLKWENVASHVKGLYYRTI